MRLIPLFLFAVLMPAFAQTSLWKVGDGVHTLYVGGTIHVLRRSDYPLPREFDAAYERADALVFETDIGEAENPEFVEKMLEKLSYAPGRSLRDDLTEETYAKLKTELAREGMQMSCYDRFKAPMAVMTLTGVKLEKEGMDRLGVDRHYFLRALSEGKKRYFLESVDEQIALIADMGKGNEEAMVLQALEEIAELKNIFEALTAAWRQGDGEMLYRRALEPMARDYPQLYRELIKRRNDAWMRRLVPMMQKGRTLLVLVGALHLVGEDGLLEQFKKRGFRVEPF